MKIETRMKLAVGSLVFKILTPILVDIVALKLALEIAKSYQTLNHLESLMPAFNT